MYARPDDDAAHDTVSVTHTAAGGGYGGVTAEMMITVIDDDTAAVMAVPSPLAVREGESGSFDVSLASQPTGPVTVSISVTGDDGAVSVLPSSLTFTTGNWNAPRPVTVTAAEDDDTASEQVPVKLSASDADPDDVSGYDGLTAEVSVAVTDNDEPALVAPESVTVVEEGSAVFEVSLATEPSGPVTVSVSVTGDDTVTAAANAALTFAAGDWSTPQTVTVSAADDDDATNETATVTLTASGGDYGAVTAAVEVEVIDNDTPAVVVHPTALTIDEGKSEQFGVRLATEPSAPLNVRVSAMGDDGAVSVSPSSLAFDTDNWQTERTVTVIAWEDANATSEQVRLELTASDADANDVSGYDGLTAAVSVAVIDNDTPTVLVSPEELTVPEGESEGESGVFAVALATLPSDQAEVTVSISVTDDDGGGTVSAQPASLTFTTENWQYFQTVTVTAAHDDDLADETAEVTLTASGGDYDGLSAQVAVNVTDDDTAALVVDPTSLTINEGEDEAFDVSLKFQPADTVTVTVAVPAPGGTVSASPQSLTFTTANWSTPQPVTVTAADNDVDADIDAGTVDLTATGGEYNDATAQVTVNVTDDDTAAVSVSPTALTVPEGGSGSYTVALDTEPSAGGDRHRKRPRRQRRVGVPQCFDVHARELEDRPDRHGERGARRRRGPRRRGDFDPRRHRDRRVPERHRGQRHRHHHRGRHRGGARLADRVYGR